MRYIVVDGSESGHCCFEASVVDTTRPFIICGKHFNNRYEPVCECHDRQDAEQIAAALNAAEREPVVYLIERINISPMENELHEAITWQIAGFVDHEEDAQRIVASAGVEIGTGWPIAACVPQPRARYRRVEKVSPPVIQIRKAGEE